MNLLEVNHQQAILSLRARGWSQRRIARELGIHRETVGKYSRSAQVIPVIAQALAETIVAVGEFASADSKPATLSGDIAAGAGSSAQGSDEPPRSEP